MPRQIQLPILDRPIDRPAAGEPKECSAGREYRADASSPAPVSSATHPVGSAPLSQLSPELIEQAAERLLRFLRDLSRSSGDSPGKHLLVAFSGGVDSSLVAAAAWRAVGRRAVAVTGVSPAVSQEDRQAARELASALGVPHVLLLTTELSNQDYVRNDARRCFHCKDGLYQNIDAWARSQPPLLASELSAGETDATGRAYHLLSGTNHDDLGDYRPGLQAASKWQVVAPLAELGIDKAMVRSIARLWQLPGALRPASPCLASRLAYGQAVSADRLERIEAAESFLKQQLGLVDVRVRLHAGELARVEIDRRQWSRLMHDSNLERIDQHLKQLGFHFVTLDLGGRQSGSLNRGLPEAGLGAEAATS